jgi:hypothetical protein
LRLLGLSESDYPVHRGVQYLLGREKSLRSKGHWVKPSKSFFQQYHAIYCALVGLLPFDLEQDVSLLLPEWRSFFLPTDS